METPQEYYERKRKLGLTDDITSNPNPDYNQPFYQNIFRLMESYAQLRDGRQSQLKNAALSIFDVSKCADIEEPYFDKKGKQIKEFAVLKVYHFFGVNDQGRGRKHHYMYKWIRLKEFKCKKYWVAWHLNEGDGSCYNLCAVADRQTRIIANAEIVQQY